MALITHIPIFSENSTDWQTNLCDDSYTSVGNIDNIAMSSDGPLTGCLQFRGTASILHTIKIPKRDTLGVSFWIGMPNGDSYRTSGHHQMLRFQLSDGYYIYAYFYLTETTLDLKVGTSQGDALFCEQPLLTDLESVYKIPCGLRWIPFQFSLDFKNKTVITSTGRKLSMPTMRDITNQTVSLYIGGNVPSSTNGDTWTNESSNWFTNLWGIGDIRIYDKALSTADISHIRQRLLCHFTFDDIGTHKTAPAITDKSGYHSDPINVTSVSADSSSPRIGKQSAIFSGSTARFISCSTRLQRQYPLTWSIWLYMDNWSLYKSSDMRAVSAYVSNTGFGLCSDGEYVSFKMSDGIFGGALPCTSNIKWSDLNAGWHMFSATFDGFYVRGYIDGVLAKQSSKTSTYYGFGFLGAKYRSTLYLGGEAGESLISASGKYFTGKMDDFRFYASDLSDADIKRLYGMRGSIDNAYNLRAYHIEEGSNFNVNSKGNVKAPVIIENKYYHTDDGAKFLRIFYHDIKYDKSLFTSGAAGSAYTYRNRFSRLKDIPAFKSTSGKYEFLLRYPSVSPSLYNRWRQTANPLTTKSDATQTAASMGYEAVTISWANNWLYGLGLSSSTAAYLDAQAGSSSYYYAIGQSSLWNNGFPGPEGAATDCVELYIRIDNTSFNGFSSVNKDVIYMDEFIEE